MVPEIVKMDVYPVAGRDCMELNLSGAHAPYFTRNIVVLTDSRGELGVGEVPGGEKITAALQESRDLVIGTRLGEYKNTLIQVKKMLEQKGEEDEHRFCVNGQGFKGRLQGRQRKALDEGQR